MLGSLFSMTFDLMPSRNWCCVLLTVASFRSSRAPVVLWWCGYVSVGVHVLMCVCMCVCVSVWLGGWVGVCTCVYVCVCARATLYMLASRTTTSIKGDKEQCNTELAICLV